MASTLGSPFAVAASASSTACCSSDKMLAKKVANMGAPNVPGIFL
jgi:hypothetical protein